MVNVHIDVNFFFVVFFFFIYSHSIMSSGRYRKWMRIDTNYIIFKYTLCTRTKHSWEYWLLIVFIYAYAYTVTVAPYKRVYGSCYLLAICSSFQYFVASLVYDYNVLFSPVKLYFHMPLYRFILVFTFFLPILFEFNGNFHQNVYIWIVDIW